MFKSKDDVCVYVLQYIYTCVQQARKKYVEYMLFLKKWNTIHLCYQLNS